jgi:D-arabinose 1-dehydrogenase-like Zn-dependent alcohol dehydrogenase
MTAAPIEFPCFRWQYCHVIQQPPHQHGSQHDLRADQRLAGRPPGLITGGTKGMGRAIADRLAFAGATVLVTARTAPANQDVAFVAADVGTAEGVATMVDQVRQRFGGADILVDNVGGSPP